MAPLNITKIAFGCSDLNVLRDRIQARSTNGTVTISTRYRPKQYEELLGGSLYWILKHKMVARQTILGFEEEETGRCAIRLDANLVPVVPRLKRAHQGWRYLKGEDAPQDLSDAALDEDEVPAELLAKLSMLGLI